MTKTDTRSTLHADPFKLPAYFIGEAARYLRLPSSTVRQWVSPSEGRSAPLIIAADPDYPLLSFENLLELHVLSSARRLHGVKLNPIRKAVAYLRNKLGSQHPLADHAMLTNGSSLFIDRYGDLVNISEDGQLHMKELLFDHLKRIVRDDNGIPIKLLPFTRNAYQTSPELVAINPRVKSGRPCINGTGVPTSIIAERYDAGDSIKLLVEDYGRSPEEIEEAVRFESRRAS